MSGHTASSQEAARDEHWCSAHFLLFILCAHQPMGWCRPHLEQIFTPQLTKSRASLTDMFKVSKAILDLVKLATIFTMAGVVRGWCRGDEK